MKLKMITYGSLLGLCVGFVWGVLWVGLLMTGSQTASDLFWDIHQPLLGLFEPVLQFFGPPDAVMEGLVVLCILFTVTGLISGFLVSIILAGISLTRDRSGRE